MAQNKTGMTRAKRKAKILIADDHPIVRYGISRIINRESDMEVCGESENGNELPEMILKSRPDLVLLDISLKNNNGLVITKNLSKTSGVPVLILSMHDEATYARKALLAGAKGYIMKEESANRLVDAVRQVLRGQIYLSENMKRDIVNNFAGGTDPLRQEEGLSKLSLREKQVFVMLGKGLTSKDIAWSLSLSHKTVETHRTRIKEKLGIPTSHKLLFEASQWVGSNPASTQA